MDKSEFDPLAQLLLTAYLETAGHSRALNDEYGQPPTVMLKAHHLRYVLQTMLDGHSRYRLTREFIEFGRVQVYDRQAGQHYLLRSNSAMHVDNAKRAQKETLFDTASFEQSDVKLLVYRFARSEMELLVSSARRMNGSRWKLQAVGVPSPMGMWPYEAAAGGTFDQQVEDPFLDLGDLDIDDEDDEG